MSLPSAALSGWRSPWGLPSEMIDAEHLYPVVVIQDRFGGLYSGGNWLAIAEADTPHDSFLLDPTRAGYCLEHGPNSDDDAEAMIFWRNRPEWIASADTPDKAVAALIGSASYRFEGRNAAGKKKV